MEKLLVLYTVVLFSLSGTAQTVAYPMQRNGVAIFALLAPIQPHEVVETRYIKNDEPPRVNSFIDKLDVITQWKTASPFDAILTRDGMMIQYIRWKSEHEEPQGLLVNMAGKEVDMYFLSDPVRPFTVVEKKAITDFVWTQSIVSLGADILKVKLKLAYDAVVVGEDEVKYVVYVE